MSEKFEEIVQDIKERLDGIGKSVEPAVISQMVRDNLKELMENDPELVRKMKFGNEPEPKLLGSKFARWGLNTSDIEFLHDLMTANGRKGGEGPSEELTNAFNVVSDAIYLPADEVRRIDKQAIDNLFPRVHKGNRA